MRHALRPSAVFDAVSLDKLMEGASFEGEAVFTLVTSTAEYDVNVLMPNWWASKHGADHSLMSSRKVAVDVRKR